MEALRAPGLDLLAMESQKEAVNLGFFYFFKFTGSAPPRVKRMQLKLVLKQPDPSA
ncbi:MAG: hypothetical protein K2Z81_14640 [Cyanobacteria bacterium]|nr:hypothetical protein [Cyanobacteriota bacterium]